MPDRLPSGILMEAALTNELRDLKAQIIAVVNAALMAGAHCKTRGFAEDGTASLGIAISVIASLAGDDHHLHAIKLLTDLHDRVMGPKCPAGRSCNVEFTNTLIEEFNNIAKAVLKETPK